MICTYNVGPLVPGDSCPACRHTGWAHWSDETRSWDRCAVCAEIQKAVADALDRRGS